ncbi:MAG: DUF1428 domain-containing protein, partial [Phycisphaerales bacterium]|nr:DUF1428 domain-containing protein [Phycisphaerales bacterium]
MTVVAKKNLKTYMKLAARCGRLFREYGAVQFCECAGDDLNPVFGTSFLKMTKAKSTETVVLSWVVYKNKAARDRASVGMMKAPRMEAIMNPRELPFDPGRM